MYIDYFIVIVSLLFSAFFEGMEIAYVSSNKISIEIEKKNNNISSKILSISLLIIIGEKEKLICWS